MEEAFIGLILDNLSINKNKYCNKKNTQNIFTHEFIMLQNKTNSQNKTQKSTDGL